LLEVEVAALDCHHLILEMVEAAEQEVLELVLDYL
jgi:hypothetical protein